MHSPSVLLAVLHCHGNLAQLPREPGATDQAIGFLATRPGEGDHQAVEAAGWMLSAWIAETVSRRLRRGAGHRGAAKWEIQHEPLTEEGSPALPALEVAGSLSTMTTLSSAA